MTFPLATQDQRLDLLEVVDRNRPHEAVLAFGEERAGADEAEQLVINVAWCDQVHRPHPGAKRTGDRAQFRAPACGALLADRTADPAQFDERQPLAAAASQAALA